MTGVKIYNVGDLVDFIVPTAFHGAEKRYRTPGIVVEVREDHGAFNTFKKAYVVHWAYGKTTTEWECYLAKLSEA